MELRQLSLRPGAGPLGLLVQYLRNLIKTFLRHSTKTYLKKGKATSPCPPPWQGGET